MLPLMCWFTLSVVLLDLIASLKLFSSHRAGKSDSITITIPKGSKVTITINEESRDA